MSRKTYFNKLWLFDPNYKDWILEDDTSNTKAKCKKCCCDIDLSNMGTCALDSHAKGFKHVNNCKSQTSLFTWLKKSGPSLTEIDTSTSDEVHISSTAAAAATAATSSASTIVELSTTTTPTNSLSKFLNKEDVMKAEIMWTLHIVTNHQSFISNAGASKLFRIMFPDSEIASKFSCERTKMSYVTVFGLAPYFQQKLYNKLNDVPIYSVSFDESYNPITKNEQMDFSVRFWDEEKQQIVDRYLDSQFLGHTKANDLLTKFNEGTSKLDSKKILQISMDGPNVNLKFYEDYKTERETIHPQVPALLDIGSCSLHVVHGAFKTAFDETGWKVGKILRSLWYLFKDSPARREDYQNITGSHEFPLQFCGTRWLEDSDVAERAIDIWNPVTKYINTVLSGPKKNIPKCASFNEVAEATKDPLMIAKLSLFVNVAKLLKPYLTLFQSEKPLVPFLGIEVGKILKSIMERFLSKRVFPDNQTLSSLFTVDIDKQSDQLPLDKVFIGYSAKSHIAKSEITSDEEMPYRKESVLCYKKLIKKLRERSPLKYNFIRYIRCLDPNYISSNPKSSISKFEHVLTLMLDNNYLKGDECDDLIRQYKDFIKLCKIEYLTKFAEYNVHSDRLDDFLFSVIGMKDEFSRLWAFIKMVLTLSHGQAAIERGFSINKNVISTNMLQKTIIAQRIVCDGVDNAVSKDSLEKFQIDKELLACVRNSRAKYEQYVKENKNISKENAIASSKIKLKNEISAELKHIEYLEKSVKRLEKEANSLSEAAEKEKKMSLLTESNKTRKRSLELKDNIEESRAKMKKLELELKKLK